MILVRKNIYAETLNTIRINNSFGSGITSDTKKTTRLYIALFIGGFVILNVLAISLFSFS